MPTTQYLQKRIISEQKQKGYAWFRFYENVNQEHEVKIQIKEKLEEIVPTFIQNELKELYEQLKIDISCPICFEELSKEEIAFSSCGHKFCAECLSKIDICAICKKKIYKKK